MKGMEPKKMARTTVMRYRAVFMRFSFGWATGEL
jgi:hypothetical protein